MTYGQLPKVIDNISVNCKEMMFYQYLPMKLSGKCSFRIEDRLSCFNPIINAALNDFLQKWEYDKLFLSNIYLTVKRQYQSHDKLFNRPGYHSDGFMTGDINYIWSDTNPTVFNTSAFNLTMDDELSLREMKEQALPENEVMFPNNTLLRLDQYVIHKVNQDYAFRGMRTFVKISLSEDRYDLEGNAHNYLLDYNWEMKPRQNKRNIPQTTISDFGG